jgi:hypothetical protein
MPKETVIESQLKKLTLSFIEIGVINTDHSILSENRNFLKTSTGNKRLWKVSPTSVTATRSQILGIPKAHNCGLKETYSKYFFNFQLNVFGRLGRR